MVYIQQHPLRALKQKLPCARGWLRQIKRHDTSMKGVILGAIASSSAIIALGLSLQRRIRAAKHYGARADALTAAADEQAQVNQSHARHGAQLYLHRQDQCHASLC